MTVASENIEAPTVWNIHENRHAFIVHLGGKMDHIETEIDRRASKLVPPSDGEFWLIPAGSEYFTYTRGKTVSYVELFLKPDYIDGLFDNKTDIQELIPQIGQYDSFLHQNVKELASLGSKTDDISVMLGECLSQAVCLYLFNNYNKSGVANAGNNLKFTPKRFSRLQEYIHDNLSKKITLDELASIAETTQHNLLRFFANSFGRTPAQYIIEQRLRKARSLLAKTRKDITSIALETGFSSHSHLTSTFKKKLNLTPQEFRQLQ